MSTASPTPQQSAAVLAAPKRRARWKTALGWIVYVLFIVLLVEGALQTFYRVSTGSYLWDRSAQAFYVAEPFGGFAMQPNLHYRHSTPEFSSEIFTNSRGFRVSSAREEYAADGDPNVYRVLLLGPSFAFGWGVDHADTFAARLEQKLNALGFGGQRPVQVINRGVPALPPPNQLAWYKGEGYRLRPDLVIQFVYGSMAVNLKPLASQVYRGYLVTGEPTLSDRFRAAAKQSAVVFYTWTVFTRLSTRSDASSSIAGAGREMSVVTTFEPNDPANAGSLEYYEAFRQTVSESGAEPLLVYFPLAYCVHREDLARWRHLGVQNVDQQIQFDESFVKYLRDRGYSIVNATADLVAAAQNPGVRLYYLVDVHWNPAGNEVVAEAVAKWMKSQQERLAAPRTANP